MISLWYNDATNPAQKSTKSRLKSHSIPVEVMTTQLPDRLLEVLPDELLEEINQRNRDPYQDRRSGEDKRQIYSLSYFSEGGKERRVFKERRKEVERREGYVRIGPWTSVGPSV